MFKLLHSNLFRFWLLLLFLSLSACEQFTPNQSMPAVSDIQSPSVDTDLPALSDNNKPSQDEGADSLSSIQPKVVLHLPYVSVRDDTIMECLSPEAQGLGSSIAGSYGISDETVMNWYCSGYTFEDILLALQTAAQVNVSPQDLLDRLGQGQTWDGIWVDIGLLK